MRGRSLTILAGAALIAGLVPLAQFVSIGMLNADMETASPSGWAIGLVASLVLTGAALHVVVRRFHLPARHVVILYTMLSIAVPLMNVGLVRPLLLTLRAAQQHFVNLAQNTYRTAYEAESPAWFPVVPTREGLAWNKADRLLLRLGDAVVQADRARARRNLLLLLNREGQVPTTPPPVDVATGLVSHLGIDELESLSVAQQKDAAARRSAVALGIAPCVQDAATKRRAASAGAADRLLLTLPDFDEQEACYVPATWEQLDRSTRQRLEEDRQRLSDAERLNLEQRIARMTAAWGALRRDVTALSAADASRVRQARAAAYRQAWAALPADRLTALRASFVFRSSGPERAALYAQDGRDGQPSQNLLGFQSGIETGGHASSVLTQMRAAAAAVPWQVWLPPLAMWSALCLCLFLFLMCMAETLRRKWVDRENLAFPLVEVVDHLIRHDFALEAAADPRDPSPRPRAFARLFWCGAAVGALILAVESLSHYRMLPGEQVLAFDLSTRLFTSGALKEMDHVIFVLSPIVVGVLFLVSLEISFSVWMIFLLYTLAFFVGKQVCGEIKDSVFTGWAGGRFYPFPMEQLLGASLCFTAVLLWKVRPRRGTEGARPPPGEAYVPRRWHGSGLMLLPLAIVALLWNLGMHNVPFVLLTGALVLALAVAAARLRAESGLPTQHATYEFTKLPMVFGLTGWTGARVYTLFVSLAVLPVSLLFRTLAQQLENIELARRNHVGYRTVAAASLTAFVVAVPMGLVSYLVLAYWRGSSVYAGPQQPNIEGIMHYPLWVSHFLGERGLDQMRQTHDIRVAFVALGAAVFGVLALLRSRVMRFPLHPLGYLLILSSIYFGWVSPYYKGSGSFASGDASWLWGSALVAWLVKKLIVKYGGMNGYKQAKPFFIGLVAGSLFCLFAVSALHLAATLAAANPNVVPGPFLKAFLDVPAYSPEVY